MSIEKSIRTKNNLKMQGSPMGIVEKVGATLVVAHEKQNKIYLTMGDHKGRPYINTFGQKKRLNLKRFSI